MRGVENGITDRGSLVGFGVLDFAKLNFGEFGKGVGFAGKVLGSSIKGDITKLVLAEIADLLKLPKLSEQNKKKWREVLASHGVMDRRSLMKVGSVNFGKLDFGEHGKGASFAGKVLGRSVRISLLILAEMAGELFGKETDEERKEGYLRALEVHTILDRWSLFDLGPGRFKGLDFGEYGGGMAFMGNVFGRSIGVLTNSDLRKMSVILDLPNLSEQKKEECRTMLAVHKIIDRESLIKVGSVRFKKLDFLEHGKGTRFAGKVLDRSVNVNYLVLNEIADVLFGKESEEGRIKSYLEALACNGVTDKGSLLRKGKNFQNLDFGMYGKGTRFAGKVLGRRLRVSILVLTEMAEILGLPNVSEENREKYRDALANHGVTDRRSLMDIGPVSFTKLDFGEHGRGANFAKKVLGRSVRISLLTLTEMADDLFGKETDEEKKGAYLRALASHGVTDGRSLMGVGTVSFKRLDYGEFGKGKRFAGKILGKVIPAISLEILGEIADVMFPEEPDVESDNQNPNA